MPQTEVGLDNLLSQNVEREKGLRFQPVAEGLSSIPLRATLERAMLTLPHRLTDEVCGPGQTNKTNPTQPCMTVRTCHPSRQRLRQGDYCKFRLHSKTQTKSKPGNALSLLPLPPHLSSLCVLSPPFLSSYPPSFSTCPHLPQVDEMVQWVTRKHEDPSSIPELT